MRTVRALWFLAAMASVAVGQHAGDLPPALLWNKLKGACPASLDWASLRGQVVVVSFGTDPVLPDEIAEWNDVQHNLRGKPVVFLQVVGGSEFLLDQALTKTAYEGCILFVTDSGNQDHFKLPHFPRTVVVDQLGFIAGYSRGGPDEQAVRAVLNHETTNLPETPPEPHYPGAVEDDVPSWEVHIAPAPKNELRKLGEGGPDRYISTNQPLRLLIPTLWDMPMARIVFPADLDERNYDVAAHIPVADSNQLLKLVQDAVEGHFGLRIEKEMRMERIYVMTAAGPSSQLQPAASGEQEMWGGGPGTIYGTARTMPEIAKSLEGWLEAPVADETGVKGKFDYTASSPASGLQAALEMARQLGLDLAPSEGHVEMLVVRKDRPE
ncbi:MAG: TIGR03435 family protein [Bryobacteraceae bacterium]